MAEPDTRSAARNRSLRPLLTPEGLEIRIELAPVAGRIAAFALDFTLMLLGTALAVLAIMGLAAATGSSPAWQGLAMLVSFFIWNGYFLFFELRWRGSTPGKRWMGLKVVSRDGGPLSTGAVFARNLMRELELYLPLQLLLVPQLLYGPSPYWASLLASGWAFIFLLMPLLNRDRARCGDLVGGTLVVVRPEAELLPDAAEQRTAKQAESRYRFDAAQLDMYGIRELQVLEDILQRDAYDPRRADLLRLVCDKIKLKIGYRQPVPEAEVLPFLQAFYRAQRRRLEGRLLLGERRERKKQGRLQRP
jgi:uncharacterized RDD family membrane protein YckC